jgi:hypothetical protein
MNFIRIRNLRSIGDSGDILLSPITVLVGANSAGKSSFLRVLPLLRQSAETRTGSGLLLNEPYVDYGLFSTALRNHADPAEMEFTFGFELTKGQQTFIAQLINQAWQRIPVNVRVAVAFAKRPLDERYSFPKKLAVTLEMPSWKDEIELVAAEDGKLLSLRINDYVVTDSLQKLRLRAGRGIVPSLLDATLDQDTNQVFVADEATRLNAFTDELLALTGSLFHGRTLRSTKIEILRAVRVGPPDEMLKVLGRITDNGSWNSAVGTWGPTDALYQKFRNLIIGDNLGDILSAIAADVNTFSRSVSYFEPVRARVQRDYVSRDIQVDSIEPDGKNVAMFISSLRNSERVSLQDWMKVTFGFSVYPAAVGDGSRIALRVREEGTKMEQNLADMGFGYSQILPLLVQIWALTERYKAQGERFRYAGRQRGTFGIFIAIEQPELHLHPALQSKLADLLVNTVAAAKLNGLAVRFLVETHSQAIINRIGYLVEQGKAPPESCQVLLFERRPQPGDDVPTSVVRKATFDENGVLQDWPFGFLSPSAADFEPVKTFAVGEASSPPQVPTGG